MASDCRALTVCRPSASIVQHRSHSRPFSLPEWMISNNPSMLGVSSSSTCTSQPGAVRPKVSAGEPGNICQKYSPSPGRVCGRTGPPRSATARGVPRITMPKKTSSREVPSVERTEGSTCASTSFFDRSTRQQTSSPLRECLSMSRSTSCGLVTALPATRSTTSPSARRPSKAPPVVTRESNNTERLPSLEQPAACSRLMPW
mmetsp:Transcript_163708/g.525033  ORF Transcript_163708/g.525033 Transcript_163708/m.525033 type:complete len:202 (+) Transcript_163708:161-766(+)